MRVIGLTGGIASGKSTVGRFLVEFGIPGVDADTISRELSAPGGAAHAAIQQRFGTSDRAALRGLVFADPGARRDLEAILHPLIAAASAEALRKLGAPVVFYEASLLVETGRYRDFDGLITVEAPLEKRLDRLCARDGRSREEALRIIRSQAQEEDRRKVATWVLQNDGDTENLRGIVADLAHTLKTS